MNPSLHDSHFKIYDTAGQEDFSAVRDQYIRIGEGFICMYSITNDASFQEVSTLRDKLVDITEEESHPVVLVGNKCDLEDDRQVQKLQAQGLASKYGWTFIEASAKNKINVTETFHEIVRCIRRHRKQGDGGGDDKGGDDKGGQKARRGGGCYLF